MRKRRAVRLVSAVLAAGTLVGTATACSLDETVFSASYDEASESRAAAVSVPPDAAEFRSSAIGPERLNYQAPVGDPMAYVDPELLEDDGKLPEGMSVTEAQALQVLDKLSEKLSSDKFELTDVSTVRAYITTDRSQTDYDGWERAFRRYFANIDLETGGSVFTESVEPTASSDASATSSAPSSAPSSASASASASEEPTETTSEGPYPVQDNGTRPTVTAVGVASQPTAGWMIQVEIEAFKSDD